MANIFQVESFKPSMYEASQVRKKWGEWITHVTTVIAAQRIDDPEEKKTYLKAYGGPELQTLIRNIPGADVPSRSALDGFAILVAKLGEHFQPTEHGIFSRHKFWAMEKGPEEALETYVLRLREKAGECSFGKNENESRDIAIIDKLLLSSPKELKEKMLQKSDLNLDQAIQMANAFFTVRQQVNQNIQSRILVALQDIVKTNLNELLETDIIEKVETYSEFYPLPTFENLMPRLEGANIFSKQDIKSAFHQCLLDKQSRTFETFVTPWGRFRYKRRVFGVTCAPEIFQRVMTDILVGCRNVIIFIDDILVYAKSEEEHNKHLSEVICLSRAQFYLV